jgi:hypothetical protein
LRLFFSAIFSIFGLCQAALATDPPTITPATGVYSTYQSTATITGDAGASFFYTLDGSTPTGSSTPYTVPFTIANPATIKAIAILSGVSSTVTTALVQSDPNTLGVPRTGLQLWLKTDFGPVTSGSNVTQWNDLSGAVPANNAAQATSTKQPTVVTGAINGYNSVSFNGSSDYMSLTTGLSNLTTGVSIFAVASPLSSTTAKTLFTSGSSGVTDMVSLQTNGTTAIANFNNGTTASNVTTASGALTAKVFQVLDTVQNGAASGGIDVNALNAITGTVQNLNNVTRSVNYIGGNSTLASTGFWGGQLSEILCYSRVVTTSEEANIQAYLMSRFQIPTTATTPTPIISLPTSTLTAPAYVAISAIPTATVHITLNGTTPTSASPVYLSPVNVAYTQTLKAIAISPAGISSSVATSTFTLNAAQWPAPSSTDTTPLQLNLQLPTTAIPQ